jgi:methionine synthase II (cobalamin-independent)
MFLARLAFVLPLMLAGEAAVAQTRDRPASPKAAEAKTPEELQDIQKRVAESLKTCLDDWDKSTHMTKAEWRVTCQRVANERGRFLAENPNVGARRR